MLSLLAPVAAGGCLVAESPEYGAPRQTAALIDHLNVVPAPKDLLIVERGLAPLAFTIPVRSEDAGEELTTAFFIDYGFVTTDRAIDDQSHPPGTFEVPRDLTTYVDLSSQAPDGCHQLTLLVLHSSHFDDGLDEPRRTDAAKADMRSVTWWMNVNAPEPYTLVNCPSSTSPPTPETAQ